MHAQGSVSTSSIALVALIESCQERDQGSPLSLDWQMIYLPLLAEWLVGLRLAISTEPSVSADIISFSES